MNSIIAQINLGPIRGIGPLGLEGDYSGYYASFNFNRVISVTIAVMTIIAFIWFTFQLFTGAIQVMTAGGDKTKVTEAKGKIANGLTGLIITISAIFILSLISLIFGIDFLGGALLFDYISLQP